eukprot:gene13963-29725_t
MFQSFSNAGSVEEGSFVRASNEESQIPICRFFQRGSCRYGANCRYRHPEVGVPEESIDCGICYDKVTSSFGLLNCKCAFCLDCIRSWRCRGKEIQQKETVRLCPLCRTETLYVVPSPVFITDSTKKEDLRQQYISNCSQIRCKYYRPSSPTSCPFGSSCFYAHLLEDGTRAPIEQTRPRCPARIVNRRHRFNSRSPFGRHQGQAIDFGDLEEFLSTLFAESTYLDEIHVGDTHFRNIFYDTSDLFLHTSSDSEND